MSAVPVSGGATSRPTAGDDHRAAATDETTAVRPQAPVPPRRLAGLPLDRRGFVVPAEAGWDEAGPYIAAIGPDQTLALALVRCCGVCGYELRPGEPVYRLFNQLEAADRRLARSPLIEDAVPGHLVCMLYSSQICPFWSSPGARLGKGSLVAPGARRGGRAALLGFDDFGLLVPVGTSSTGPQLLYGRLVEDVGFRSPADLAERYERARVADDVPAGPRGYWTGSDEDQSELTRLLSAGVAQLRRQAGRAERVGGPDGSRYLLFEVPVVKNRALRRIEM